MTTVDLRGVHWGFADGATFGPIDLHIDGGDRIAVIGHHGSGKTSLLRLLVGTHLPAQGEVLIDGHPAGSADADDQVSAMIHPLPLDDERTMRRHLEVAAAGTAGWGDDAYDLAQRLGLAERFDDPVRMFSRGMRQKLAICMALLPQFDLLVLDEPFDGLDARSRRTALELFDLAHRYGATVVVATNDLEAASLSDRVIAMRRGEVIADVTPDADLEALIADPEAPSNAPRQELE